MKVAAGILGALAVHFFVALGIARAGHGPVIVDQNNRVISEDYSHVYLPRWSKANVSVESFPGGPTFEIEAVLYPLNSAIPNRISRIAIRFDGRHMTDLTRRELREIENPKLARMRIQTTGKGNMGLVIMLPMQTQCATNRSSTETGEYMESDFEDSSGDDDESNGYAYISIQRFLDHPKTFHHHVILQPCKEEPRVRASTLRK